MQSKPVLAARKREGTNQKAGYFLKALEKEEQRLANGKMAGEWEPAAPTIEHVLPKKPGSDWASVIKAGPEIVDECVIRLGNLCLLTNIYEKLGNKGFATKKLSFAKSDLLTTKAVASYSTWNRSAIEARQGHLAKLAKSVWRFG